MSYHRLLKKIDRYVLIPSIAVLLPLMMVSGYAITAPQLVEDLTFGLVGYHNAYVLHFGLMMPVWLLTLSHCFLNLCLAVKGRLKGRLGRAASLALIAVYLLLIAVPIYVEYAVK